MKPSSALFRFVAVLAGAAAFFTGSLARAQAVFLVQLNTTALIGHPAGPFYLDFQLNDGAGIGNANNTAVISQFNFGGGTFLPGPTVFGGASGSLASSVTLTDTTPFNEFFQGFTPGASLSFRLSLTTNVNAPAPDLFSFSILDGAQLNVRTLAPGNSDALVIVNLTGNNPVANAYAGNGVPFPGATAIAFPAPNVAAIPEPSTYGVLGAVLLGSLSWFRRRRAAADRRALTLMAAACSD